MSQSVTQRALQVGFRRAIDPITRSVGELDLSKTVRPWCMSDAERDEALALAKARQQRLDAYRGAHEDVPPQRPAEKTSIDHYETGSLLNDRQLYAARRLARLYHKGRPRIGSLTANLMGQPGGGKGEMSDHQAECWKEYCRVLDAMPPRTRHAVAQVAAGGYPQMANGLSLLRDGLDAACNFWAAQAKKILDERRILK
jgi:hypothetical protein